MDDVPVKIAERYKPPPSVYQLPQTIVNRLGQYNVNYYHEHSDYQYDFQVERNELSKVRQWRQMRQQQQDERHARQERRKRERQRALEAHQKEMLGAVEYPSAAELSSDSEEDEEFQQKPSTVDASATATPTTAATTSLSGVESREEDGNIENEKSTAVTLEPKSINACNFNTILQPTVLSCTVQDKTKTTLHKRNSSLNYADFEYNMNSTPFDNIELKTINDLDILAQVLHNTQLKAQTLNEAAESTSTTLNPQSEELSAATRASVNSQAHCDEENIPGSVTMQSQSTPNCNYTPIYQIATPTMQPYNAVLTTPSNQQLSYPLQLQAHAPSQHIGNNQHYYQQTPLQQIYNNQNYLITSHTQQHYLNGYTTVTQQPVALPTRANLSNLAEEDAALKSKSVPDILRELKAELADKRRVRNHSQNAEHTQSILSPQATNVFSELAGPAQKLAQHISGMGFPLERVAKVIRICGIDDKKIIEHLIPLSELVDLGFDETKISAALLKFDNNKDKALDYLIN